MPELRFQSMKLFTSVLAVYLMVLCQMLLSPRLSTMDSFLLDHRVVESEKFSSNPEICFHQEYSRLK